MTHDFFIFYWLIYFQQQEWLESAWLHLPLSGLAWTQVKQYKLERARNANRPIRNSKTL